MMVTVKRYISAGVLDPSKDMPTFTNQVVDQLMVQLNDQVKLQVASQVEEQMADLRAEMDYAHKLRRENILLENRLKKTEERLSKSWITNGFYLTGALILGAIVVLLFWIMAGFVWHSVGGFWTWITTTPFGWAYVFHFVGALLLTLGMSVLALLIVAFPGVVTIWFFNLTDDSNSKSKNKRVI